LFTRKISLPGVQFSSRKLLFSRNRVVWGCKQMRESDHHHIYLTSSHVIPPCCRKYEPHLCSAILNHSKTRRTTDNTTKTSFIKLLRRFLPGRQEWRKAGINSEASSVKVTALITYQRCRSSILY
jgi:hypothetical protein